MPDAVAADLLLGERYRLLRQLARGGMATVWEAEDSVLGRHVAVKVLHPHLAVDDAFRERFRREAVAVARLSHPSIVGIYDTGQDGTLAYLVMELVEGDTLRDLLRGRGPLPVSQAVGLAAQVADGLAAAHERGIVHRDVKPANVLVLPDGRAKLTDFGIARERSDDGDRDDDLTRAGTIVGTARYLAPEQVEGGPVDARTDVYALGLVLYEMLTGRPAFDGESELALAVARTRQSPVPPGQLRAEIPRALEAVVLRAIARDPGQRFASAGELRTALLGMADDGRHPGPDHTPVAGIALPAPADRRFTLGAAAIIAVGVAVAILGLFLTGTEAGRSVLEKVREGFPGATEGRPVAIAGLADFDPEGDGSENPDLLARAYDGNLATSWRTDAYHAPTETFGNLKSGVGLIVELSDDASLDRLNVHTDGGPWDGSVYVSDHPSTDLAGWGDPVSSKRRLGNQVDFGLDGTKGRYVLLWITRLPPSGQLDVAEVDASA